MNKKDKIIMFLIFKALPMILAFMTIACFWWGDIIDGFIMLIVCINGGIGIAHLKAYIIEDEND